MSDVRLHSVSRLGLATGLVFLGLTVAMALTGVPLLSAGEAAGLVALGSLGAGAIWFASSTRRMDITEAVGVGTALFTAGSTLVLSGLAYAGVVVSAWLVSALVLVIGVGILLLPPSRAVGSRTLTVSRPAAVATIIGCAGALLVYLPRVVQYPVGSDAALGGYNQDLFFFESLANALARFGPAEGGLMAGWPARYHWLTYAFSGQVSEAAGLDPFVGLVRLVPMLSIVALALLAAAWTAQRTRGRFAPTIAVLVLLCASSIGSTANRVINWDSPSQSLGSVWLLALIVVVTLLPRARTPWMPYATIAALSIAVMGGKTSNGVLVLAALACAAAVGAIRRASWAPRIAVALLIVLAGSAAAFLVFSFGGAGSGALEPSPALLQVLGRAQPSGAAFGALTLAVTLFLAVAPRWMGVLAGWTTASARRPHRLALALASGAIAAAAIAVFTLVGETSNQSWFLDGACVIAAVPSVLALATVWTARFPTGASRRRAGVIAIAVGAVAAAIALLVGRQSDGGYILGFPSALVLLAAWWVGVLLTVALVMAATPIWRGTPWRTGVALASAAFLASALAYGAGSVLIQGVPNAPAADASRAPDALVPALLWVRDHAEPDDVIAADRDTGGLASAVAGLRGFAEMQTYAQDYSNHGGGDDFAVRRDAVAQLVDGGGATCLAGADWLVLPSARDLSPALQDRIEYRDAAYSVARVSCP